MFINTSISGLLTKLRLWILPIAKVAVGIRWKGQKMIASTTADRPPIIWSAFNQISSLEYRLYLFSFPTSLKCICNYFLYLERTYLALEVLPWKRSNRMLNLWSMVNPSPRFGVFPERQIHINRLFLTHFRPFFALSTTPNKGVWFVNFFPPRRIPWFCK